MASCSDSFTVCLEASRPLEILLIAVPLAALGVLVAVSARALVRRVGPWPRPSPVSLAVLAAATLVPLGLNRALVPPGPVVYYDEFLHAEATANLAAGRGARPCCRYVEGRCVAGGPLMWPLATHVEAAAVAALLGDPNPIARGAAARSWANRAWSVAAPTLVFIWLVLLLGDTKAALLGAWWWGLLAPGLKLQATGALMPGAIGHLLLLLILVEWLRRRPSWPRLAGVVALLALAANSRLELLLAVPWALWRLRDVRLGARQRRALWPALAALPVVLAAPVCLYLAGAASHVHGWSAGLGDAWRHLRQHLGGNLAFWFDPRIASPLLVPLAVSGLLLRSGRPLWPLAATVAALLTFESAYHIGTFSATGTDGWRYTQPLALLLLPLACSAVGAAAGRLADRRALLFFAAVAAAVAAPVAAQRRFLSSAHPAAALDHRARAWWQSHEAGTAAVVTRSVAWARSLGPANVVERCSSVPQAAFAPAARAGGARYVRSWGDAGPAPVPGARTLPVAEAGESPDGLGPWLLRYEAAPGAAAGADHRE